jgi:hypothetical protein
VLVSRESSLGSQAQNTTWQPQPGIKVYLDGLAFGGVESLTMIRANAVLEIRLLSALDATTRFGTGHMTGASLRFIGKGSAYQKSRIQPICFY